jgi:serine/threonine-protein kinase RsbW
VPVNHRPRLEQRLPARPQSITALRHSAVEYAARGGVSPRRREDVALAVSEAVSNVVVHAYDGHDEPGDVLLDASWIDEHTLQVAVSDAGNGIGRRSRRPGLGLGLSLMSHVADALRIESDATVRGLCVRMTFALD